MKNRTKFNWKCPHCRKRNIQSWRFQFDIPKVYNVDTVCSKCEKESNIEFRFTIITIPSKGETNA